MPVNTPPPDAEEAYVLSARPFVNVEISLGELLRQAAAEAPDHVALKVLRDPATGLQRQWTYAQLLQDSEAVARQLLERFRPGEHVALWSPNRPARGLGHAGPRRICPHHWPAQGKGHTRRHQLARCVARYFAQD